MSTLRPNSTRWFHSNRSLLSNAMSLVGTTVVTSALGSVYWLVAARSFSTTAVGLAAATIAAMTLLGTVGVMGTGTLLIGELARDPRRLASYLTIGIVATSTVASVLAIAFVFVAPLLAPDLAALSGDLVTLLIFMLGVSLTAIGLVLDQALIGLMRGDLQFFRNVLFGALKLVVLAGVAVYPFNSGLVIFATWVTGLLLSFVGLIAALVIRGRAISDFLPKWEWSLVRQLGPAALGHHALNLALQLPVSILPLVVTAVLSLEANAYFFAAWMIAGLTFVGARALTTVLYASGARAPDEFASKIQLTLALSGLMGVVTIAGLSAFADPLLRLAGESYAEEASFTLRILGLALIPLAIKNHYIAVRRVEGRIVSSAGYIGLAGIFELVMAAIGASVGQLPGLAVAWVLAVTFEALLMTPIVIRAASRKRPHISALP